MSELEGWLKSIGMQKYLDVFESHSIDLDIVGHLTESELSELGIPLGDRKRLIRAMKLNSGEASRPDAAAFQEELSQFSGKPVRSERSIGELRQMTIMLVDLVNSTGLVQNLGIEKYRDALKAYQNCCLAAIRNNFGHFAQFIGDGVVAYFGFPIANEDDAERAALAALEIVDKIAEIRFPPEQHLSVRIGIATGDVLIEELIHETRQADSFALGNIPNLAARLQSLAEPGQIAVTGRTRRLLGNNFHCQPAGKHRLKGFPEPVGIWFVSGSERTELRFEKRKYGAFTPLIGREHEFNLLRGRWEAACRGEGQAVFLSGEAGLGKSRLAEEVYQQLVLPDSQRLSFQCSPYHQTSALFPIKSHIGHAIGSTESDTAAVRLKKLEDFLESHGGASQDTVSVFSNLLFVGRPDVADATPEITRGRTTEKLLRYIENAAADKPILILFEDLHWIDPSSEELLDVLINRLAGLRVMVLGTYRPEYTPPWSTRPKVTTLSLPRLGARESRELMEKLHTSELIRNGMMQSMLDRSEGIPLYIEEMASMLARESDSDRKDKEERQKVPFPSNLKDLLRARLDHLSVTPDTISICAALGRSFTPELVAAIADRAPRDIAAELESLVQAQIMVPQSHEADNSFTFRHALIGEVAYDAILPQRARKLHQRIAETMVQKFPHFCERNPEILALHYKQAEQFDAARDTWQQAAALALSNYASQEAIAHLTAALDAHALLARDETSDSKEIELRQALAVALEMRSWGSPDIASNREKLISLNEKIGNHEVAFANFQQLIGGELIAGRPDVVQEYYEHVTDLIGPDANPALWTLSEHNSGIALLLMGEFGRAITHFDRALTWRTKADLSEINRYYAADPEIIDIVMRCWASALKQGDGAETQKELEEAIALARSQKSAFSRCYALSIIATVFCTLDDPERARIFAKEAHDICDTIEFRYWEAWSSVLIGWAETRSGNPDRGIDILESGLARYIETGSGQIVSFSHTLLADAYLCKGAMEEAEGQIVKARDVMAKSTVRFHENMTERIAQKIKEQREADASG